MKATRSLGLDAVVLSTQHDPDIKQKDLVEAVYEHILKPVLPKEWLKDLPKSKIHINPTGKFVIGGPVGDCGLTGRKIIVDTYGGMARHGGGAFSGKDPSKVDRSAAYAARYVAKNIVAAGLADKCEVQVTYAIGVAEPTSISVTTFGTGKISDDKIEKLIRAHFDLRPYGITKMLDLLHPIYQPTASYGHFGRKPKEMTYTDGAGKKHTATAVLVGKDRPRRCPAQRRRPQEVTLRSPVGGTSVPTAPPERAAKAARSFSSPSPAAQQARHDKQHRNQHRARHDPQPQRRPPAAAHMPGQHRVVRGSQGEQGRRQPQRAGRGRRCGRAHAAQCAQRAQHAAQRIRPCRCVLAAKDGQQAFRGNPVATPRACKSSAKAEMKTPRSLRAALGLRLHGPGA